MIKQKKGNPDLAGLAKIRLLYFGNVEAYFIRMSKESGPTIADLFPNLSESELAEAEENLGRYISIVACIIARVKVESNPQVDQLTQKTGTLTCTRQNLPLPPKP